MNSRNFNSDDHPYDQNPKKKNYTWIYISLIALLIATNLFLFFQKKESNDQSEQIMGQVTNLISEKESLQEEYDASLARLDLLTSENANLENKLNIQTEEIESSKKRIQEILQNKNATESELAEARKLIKNLQKKITTYEEEIAFLREDNELLRSTIEVIHKEQDELITQIEEAKVLGIGNINLSAISLRRKGKVEKETQKAKRADLLRVTFDLIENRLIDNSQETLYIAIINPEGYLLSNKALGSGSLLDENGKAIYYSVSKKFNIQKERKIKDITVDWVQSSDYDKGSYDVIVYHKSHIIGQSKVVLR